MKQLSFDQVKVIYYWALILKIALVVKNDVITEITKNGFRIRIEYD